ncbi:MAG: metallophosphoesterase [Candidatus Hodarchaeales archaeon]
MERKKIIKKALNHNFNLSVEALKHLEKLNISEETLDTILKMVPPEISVIDLNTLKNYTRSPDLSKKTYKTKKPETKEEKQKEIIKEKEDKEKIEIKVIEPKIKVLSTTPEKNTKKAEVETFRTLFLDRYARLYKILHSNLPETSNKIPRFLKTGQKYPRKNVIITGMVQETGVLSTNRFVINLEDPEHNFSTRVVMVKDSPSFPDYRNILRDSVISVVGDIPKNYKEGKLTIFWGKDIIRPGLKKHEFTQKTNGQNVLLISDIHYGSKYFSNNTFAKLIKLLTLDNLSKELQELAKNITTIIIAGDLVEGAGLYSDQKKELKTTSIEEQYSQLTELIAKIPEYIKIIIIPGEHDATPKILPQPAINKKFASELIKLPNTQIYGNPLRIEINKMDFLIIHGQGLDRLFQKQLRLEPTDILTGIQTLLEYRHLGLEYGAFYPLMPLDKDYLVIEKIPDVLVTGHFHQAKETEYKGVKIITCGSFQRKKDQINDLGKFYSINTGNGKITTIDLKKI